MDASLVARRFPNRHSISFEADLHRKKPIVARKRASFSTITVREYTQTIGDSPSCQLGAPITLSWSYQEKDSVALDEYEKSRLQRRRRSELIMGVVERRKILVGYGLTLLDVMRAEHTVALKNGTGSPIMQLNSMKFQDQMAMPNQVKKSAPPKRSVISRAA